MNQAGTCVNMLILNVYIDTPGLSEHGYVSAVVSMFRM